MNILGINAFHPDASAALLQDGKLVVAVEEERFNRVKHSAGFPYNAMNYCLKKASLDLKDIDYIGITNNPMANILPKVWFVLSSFSPLTWPKIARNYMKTRLTKAISIKSIISQTAGLDPKYLNTKLYRIEHHLAHAASSYFVSGFNESAILTLDGAGDFLSGMMVRGKGTKLRIIKRFNWPHSLGILYSAVSRYLGFPKVGDEGKVMGLAAYGKPLYLAKFKEIVKIGKADFYLDLDYFIHHREKLVDRWGTPESSQGDYSQQLSEKFFQKFGPPRAPGQELTQRHKDIAASLQAILEEVVFSLLEQLYRITHTENLCLAGGTFLNCVLNGMIPQRTAFKNIFVQPGAGDAGTSIGNCFYIHSQILNMQSDFIMRDSYLGTEYSRHDIEQAIRGYELKYECGDVEKKAAISLTQGKALGWFQGKMEFGPRALGNRSILADPRREEIKDILNKKVKHRESFRPFAPSVLLEHCGEYFDSDRQSPFMLMVYNVLPDKRGIVPAITHVDGTGRVQTVDADSNPAYRKLIEEFYKLTGIPLILNTSFNTKGEPINNSQQDAIETFLNSQLDVLVIGDYFIEKSKT
jgi:carbamoyltransferase